MVKSRPKVNPFGDAKPREAVLGERGMDWRKIDLELEHRSVDRFCFVCFCQLMLLLFLL